LAFPGVDIARLAAIWPEMLVLEPKIAAQLEVDARYAAYVRRQDEDVETLKRDEAVVIPASFDYGTISSLSGEIRQKLLSHRPSTLAQAGRIEGMTPAALLLLLSALKASQNRKSA
jgi:tRNA uridine 5-carboxymethylaminomethyl modification enzyme